MELNQKLADNAKTEIAVNMLKTGLTFKAIQIKIG